MERRGISMMPIIKEGMNRTSRKMSMRVKVSSRLIIIKEGTEINGKAGESEIKGIITINTNKINTIRLRMEIGISMIIQTQAITKMDKLTTTLNSTTTVKTTTTTRATTIKRAITTTAPKSKANKK